MILCGLYCSAFDKTIREEVFTKDLRLKIVFDAREEALDEMFNNDSYDAEEVDLWEAEEEAARWIHGDDTQEKMIIDLTMIVAHQYPTASLREPK